MNATNLWWFVSSRAACLADCLASSTMHSSSSKNQCVQHHSVRICLMHRTRRRLETSPSTAHETLPLTQPQGQRIGEPALCFLLIPDSLHTDSHNALYKKSLLRILSTCNGRAGGAAHHSRGYVVRLQGLEMTGRDVAHSVHKQDIFF